MIYNLSESFRRLRRLSFAEFRAAETCKNIVSLNLNFWCSKTNNFDEFLKISRIMIFQQFLLGFIGPCNQYAKLHCQHPPAMKFWFKTCSKLYRHLIESRGPTRRLSMHNSFNFVDTRQNTIFTMINEYLRVSMDNTKLCPNRSEPKPKISCCLQHGALSQPKRSS